MAHPATFLGARNPRASAQWKGHGMASTVTNVDGSTFTVRSTAGIMGTLLTVRHSVIGTAGGQVLWDGPAYGTALYYLPGGGQMVRITHPKYEHASTLAEAKRVALAFFAESYADTVAHAEAEGIPVADCFR
jgi:hypothetical protein